MARTRNDKLAAVISETGWSQAQVAAQFVRVATEAGLRDLLGTTRSHVSQWVLGSRPSGRAPSVLCEALSRGARRSVTPAEIGLAAKAETVPVAAGWWDDTVSALGDLGRWDLDMERRRFLGTAAYSVSSLAAPGESWWAAAEDDSRARATSRQRVGRSDVEAVREMIGFFSKRDQQRGGGHGRASVTAYLTSEVIDRLAGGFANDQVRREMFSAAGELVYLSGWMTFDDSQHGLAQRYFTLAVKLAAEAGDSALAAHVLRAMAHQAVDLGHGRAALELAEASVAPARFAQASPRERALLGVVHARSLAATGRRTEAMAALLRAEDDLASASAGVEEPARTFFFGEASLAHETACTLRDLGDLKGAEMEFRRSVRTRKATSFTRTHAVTLGYLGAVQAQQGAVEGACGTWTQALDAMEGVRSGRARDTVLTMRRVLSPFRNRGIAAAAELDTRATAVLRK